MKKEELLRVKNYSIKLLQSLIVGGLVGVVVGLYQLGIQYISKASSFMYSSRTWWIITLMVIIVIALSFANFFILKYAPGVDGSGIPAIELGIRGKKKIDWKKEIIAMILNSYVSTLAGFTLGSEGPSVVLGGKVAKMSHDVANYDDEDTIAMACGTGFGCAFLSPLAGLCYIFEESLHKFNPKVIVRALFMMVGAYITTSLFNEHLLLHVENITLPHLTDYYVFAFLIIINLIVGIGFVKFIVFLKDWFNKLDHIKIVKYRGFILFLIVMILNFTCLGIMGGGSTLISNAPSYQVLWVVVIILLARFLLTTLSGAGKVTGGLVVPIMTLGVLTGQIVCLISTQLFGLSSNTYEVINLISMCMIFGIVTKTPITSIVLVYTTLAKCGGDFLHPLIIMPITIVSIVAAVYLSKLLKVECLYEQLMEVTLKNDERIKMNKESQIQA